MCVCGEEGGGRGVMWCKYVLKMCRCDVMLSRRCGCVDVGKREKEEEGFCGVNMC